MYIERLKQTIKDLESGKVPRVYKDELACAKSLRELILKETDYMGLLDSPGMPAEVLKMRQRLRDFTEDPLINTDPLRALLNAAENS